MLKFGMYARRVEQKLKAGQVCGVLGRFATGSRRSTGGQFAEIEVVKEIRVVTEGKIVFVGEIEVVRGVIDGGVGGLVLF